LRLPAGTHGSSRFQEKEVHCISNHMQKDFAEIEIAAIFALLF
jgi:hypothetical protein